MKKRNLYFLFFGLMVVLLTIDQVLKFWVKTSFVLGEQMPVLGQWFNLFFIENEGMAFGIHWGEQAGKLLLSLLRLAIAGGLIWLVLRWIKQQQIGVFMLIVFSVILSGALGNIVDSLFYGLIFSESTPGVVAVFLPENGGYGHFLYGKVVDMFYLKLFLLPEWVPLWGGSYFFPAIFNFADACVTVGLVALLICNKKIPFLGKQKDSNEPMAT
ncbi:MAG: lipoprotein signal peptidase [Bacteroidales bacterium]|jgi:signal peptidase II|nr:lipoprotein signal peptidase [Bacteroidales bacterium]